MKFLHAYSLLLFVSLALTAQEIQVVNEGIGGETTRDGLNRFFESVEAYAPQHLILNFGTNDISPLNKVTPEQYRRNLSELIDRANAADIRTTCVITTHPVLESYVRQRAKLPEDCDLNERVRQYRQIAMEVAEAKKAMLLDLYTLVIEHGGDGETKESLIRNYKNGGGDDGTHFRAEGYKLIAEELYKLMKEHVKPGDKIVCLGDSITYGANLRMAGTVHGENYPSYLWKKFNPGNTMPSIMRRCFDEDGNYVPNGSFRYEKENGLPSYWSFWQKNNDTAKIMADDDGSRFYRVTSSNGERAFTRTEPIKEIKGKFKFSCRLRGKGDVLIGPYLYIPKLTEKIWTKAPLKSTWETVEMEVEIPEKSREFLIVFQPLGQADIADVRLSNISEWLEMPGTAELRNKEMTVRIAPADKGGGIVSARNPDGVEFVNLRPCGIWAIHFEKIPASQKDGIAPIDCDPETDDGTSTPDESGNALLLRSEDLSSPDVRTMQGGNAIRHIWRGIAIGDEPDALDVTVSYSLDEDGFLRIGGFFENRSRKYTAFYFQLPRISGLGGIGGKFNDDIIATPFHNGRLIGNPVQHGLFRDKRRRLSGNNAGHSLQFDLLYNNGNGLYFGTFDPLMYAKRYELKGNDDGSGIGMAVFSIPDNMTKIPQRWQNPYPAVLKTFSGDWYDGCQIYRAWATKQIWCSEGPLAQRKNIPEWFKNIDEWSETPVTRLRDELPTLTRMAEDFSGFNMGAGVFYWGNDNTRYDAMNPERFPLTPLDLKYMSFMKKHRIRTLGYIQMTEWSSSSSSYKADPEAAQQSLVRNLDGQPLAWDMSFQKGKEPVGYAEIPYPGEKWGKALGDVIVEMARNGFDGVYLDSGNHAGAYMNFNDYCNPGESGGGIGYIHGAWNLYRQFARRARAVNPEFCMTAESFWEGNIHVLDGHWTVNSTSAPLEGRRVVPAPLAQAVYHDYTIFYGYYPSTFDVSLENASSFVAKNALNMIAGIKSGGSYPNPLYNVENSEKARNVLQRNLSAYSAARKYLVYGTMLRPPRIENSSFCDIKWRFGYVERFQEVTLDAIQCSAWRAPDGTVGLILYNISDSAQDFSLALDCKEYMLDKKPVLSPLYPAQAEAALTSGADGIVITGSIPACEPLIFELR